MDIYAPPGTKVFFMGRNGHDWQLEEAMKVLKVGAIYTVAEIEVGGWSSEVFLEEIPGKSFNTVMFGDVE